MNKEFDQIWQLAIPYLEKGKMKDFVVHTEGVVKAMELLLEKENGDPKILIPAAILHDVGFSKVSEELQTNGDLERKREAQRQHLEFAGDIIREILGKVGYNADDIEKVVEIVKSHKFRDPEEHDKRMLIDADNLSDVFKEQFESDVKSYGTSAEQVYEYRTRNTYYSKTAQEIAENEMRDRKFDD